MTLMQFQRFESLICEGAECFGVALEDWQIVAMYRYFSELRRWSAKVNLISRDVSDEELVDKHFLDSLAIPMLIGGQPGRLLDVGSGAGFPGMVGKIVQPQRPVTLMEPRLKRVSFLRHVTRTLGLEEIDVLADRLGDQKAPPLPVCRWVVGRAVASVADFLALCSPLRGTGCRVICMKGPRYQEELKEVGAQGESWVLCQTKHYCLPGSDAKRVLLVFRGFEAHL